MGEQRTAASGEEAAAALAAETKKWPGWPGYNVFRMVVPVLKVGSIIGKKGELIKKLCEETRAKVKILDGAFGTTDRVVLISGKEDPEAEISPAMHAALRVFKRVNELSDAEGDNTAADAVYPACYGRLLVFSSQAISLIGKGGDTIRKIQDQSGTSVRVISGAELPFYATGDERVVDIQGESIKVLKALELVLGHLRRFLVDQSVIPLFDKIATPAATSATQERLDKQPSVIPALSQGGAVGDYTALKRDPLLFERDPLIDSQINRSGLSLYGQDPALSAVHPSGLGRATGALVTQITQTMQVPLSYAEDIIGIGGANIAYIRRTSGAILTVQESQGMPDEITVEIKGTSSQVQIAQQLIQDFIAGHKEPAAGRYGISEAGYTSYSGLGGRSSYLSSFSTEPYGGFGSSGGLGGGYGGYRY